MSQSKQVVRFPKDKSEESLGFMFWRASNLWQRKMTRNLRPLDLTLVQFVLLAGIARLERKPEPVTQIRLARHQKTDVMMTSQVLRTLESRGLVIRRESESDSRAKTLALTTSGIELVRKGLEIVQRVELDFFQPLEKKKASAFLRDLSLLTERNEIEEVKLV